MLVSNIQFDFPKKLKLAKMVCLIIVHEILHDIKSIVPPHALHKIKHSCMLITWPHAVFFITITNSFALTTNSVIETTVSITLLVYS